MLMDMDEWDTSELAAAMTRDRTSGDMRALDSCDSSLMWDDGKDWQWRRATRQCIRPRRLAFTEVGW